MTSEQLAAAAMSAVALTAAVFCVVGLVGDLDQLGIGASSVLQLAALPVAATVLAGLRGRIRARSALRGAMTARVHTHGDVPASRLQRFIGRHEVGHVVGAEATGMGVSSVRIGDGWGYVQAQRFVSVKASITFLAAGHLAVGSKRGASSDLEAIRDLARNLPRETRARDLRDAVADARRIVDRESGRIHRDGHRLADTGRWPR